MHTPLHGRVALSRLRFELAIVCRAPECESSAGCRVTSTTCSTNNVNVSRSARAKLTICEARSGRMQTHRTSPHRTMSGRCCVRGQLLPEHFAMLAGRSSFFCSQRRKEDDNHVEIANDSRETALKCKRRWLVSPHHQALQTVDIPCSIA